MSVNGSGLNGSRPQDQLTLDRPPWVASTLAVILIFTMVVDLLGNLMVILSVYRNKKLRNAGEKREAEGGWQESCKPTQPRSGRDSGERTDQSGAGRWEEKEEEEEKMREKKKKRKERRKKRKRRKKKRRNRSGGGRGEEKEEEEEKRREKKEDEEKKEEEEEETGEIGEGAREEEEEEEEEGEGEGEEESFFEITDLNTWHFN
ncbi:melatonin receptor type 1A [Crotalus adamanteus]|uniref:Melatonin receptor type 1A n=1 Tax=Crotalus adamanteus TaxID=8729 RepID=A0AAW1BBS7_CROAD